ncbi:MAG: DNA mismatch repair protein MutS [Calditrichaeota bacterium]|nr:DNA mismatch repair protein MutS [Calditrichota bacterium]
MTTSRDVSRTPLLEQFSAIKKKFPDSILFYRMGDFYEMFYDDAVIGSEILGIRLTSRAHGKGVNVPLAGFPYHQLDTYLTRMVDAGRRVVIVEQVEDPKKAKGLVKRDVVRVVTAGTNPALLEDGDLAPARIAAMIHQGDTYGYAWAELAGSSISAGTFTLPELHRLALRLEPVELIIPASTTELGPAPEKNRTGQSVSRLEDWIWEDEFARRTLTGHFDTVNLKGFGLEGEPAALAAAGALLYYLKQNLRADPSHITRLVRADVGHNLLIETSTRRNLELTHSLSGNPRATLISVIDRTVTPSGRRLLFSRLLEPLADINLIDERLDAVGEITRRERERESVRQLLKRSGDIQRMLARLATARGSPRDLTALAATLEMLPVLQQLTTAFRSELIRAWAGRISVCADIASLIRNAITDEPPLLASEGGVIRDGYDRQIDDLRSVETSGKSFLEDLESRERKATGIPNLRVGFNRVFGYYIEITRSHQGKVPSRYERRQTLTGAERYTLPELKDYEEKILTATDQIREREIELYGVIVSRVLESAATLQENAAALAEFDFLTSLAQLAMDERFHRPTLTDDDTLEIVEGRHPVVDRLLPAGETFIPNDTSLGGNGPRIAIVTGPNMAGKSTYLRQTGIIVILAQMGSFIPAKSARIGVVDRLFTRIGALDNLAGGESTFLVEMQETAAILNNATSRSLVLFDEVGRGTSTFDGLSIAWSIIEYLHETPRLRPRTLFATHFHELIDLENYLPGVVNLNVAVREYGDKVVFMRKIVPGGSDHSFGIHVARMAGIPREVIERAQDVLANLEANDLSPTVSVSPDAGNGRVDRNTIESKSGTKRLPARHTAQLSFFDPLERKLRERLESLEPEHLSPLEAHRLLIELKQSLTTND